MSCVEDELPDIGSYSDEVSTDNDDVGADPDYITDDAVSVASDNSHVSGGAPHNPVSAAAAAAAAAPEYRNLGVKSKVIRPDESAVTFRKRGTGRDQWRLESRPVQHKPFTPTRTPGRTMCKKNEHPGMHRTIMFYNFKIFV